MEDTRTLDLFIITILSFIICNILCMMLIMIIFSLMLVQMKMHTVKMAGRVTSRYWAWLSYKA